MKIVGIEVYGFGKFQSLELGNLSQEIQVFYGQNEAGKSTLMSFITHILFGFPTKQQPEQRYIPKQSDRYGGRLTILTEEYGTLTVERLPGKAVGDVVIIMPDGSVKNEEFLERLLRGMDKQFFQNIYSFNVHGLQGIHRIGPDDLGRFLFSSGAVGTDALLTINRELDKELEALFKPSGRKPLLNTELTHLKENHQKVQKLQEKNQTYHSLINQKELIEKQLGAIEQNIKSLEQEMRQCEQLNSIKPLIIERSAISKQLTELPPSKPFPTDGLKRLENFLSQLYPYKTQLKSSLNKKEEIEKQKKEIIVDELILQYEEEINELYDARKEYQKLHHQIADLENKHKQITEEILDKKYSIHTNASDQDIMKMDTSISQKEAVKRVSGNLEVLSQQKLTLDTSFNQAKEELEECDHKLTIYQKELLDKEQRNQLEHQIQVFKNASSDQNTRLNLSKSIESIEGKIKRFEESNKKSNKKLLNIFILIDMLLVILSVYYFLNTEWISALIPLGFIIFFVLIYIVQHKSGTNIAVIELKEEKKELQAKLNSQEIELVSISQSAYEEAQILIAKDQQYRQLFELEKARKLQLEKAYNRVVTQFESWEKNFYETKRKMGQICKEYQVSESNEQLMDVFHYIEQLKEKIRIKMEFLNQISSTNMQKEEYEQRVRKLAEICNIRIDNRDTLELVEKLSGKWKMESLHSSHLTTVTTKLTEINEQLSLLQLEVDYLKTKIDELYEIANVKNEEEFRKKAKIEAEVVLLQERLGLINNQLESYPFGMKQFNEQLDFEAMIFELDQKIVKNKTEQTHLFDQLSEVNIRKEELEEGGVYSEIFHEFQLKKSNFNEQAKDWAVLAVAKDLLNQTIEQYRDVRLPNLIKSAEHFLRILSEDRYVRILTPKDDEGFIVERNDGVRFSPRELSQATSEALYVAIRFALAEATHRNDHFPFIIDDSFVNFDEVRLRHVVKTLREISKEHQILFFTCHEHIIKLFNDTECINL
ncbi:ATP-binding protein [Litchfieldia alkalitelluris]|uniref:ATP-binding protein n=1 Tax=Litchfieldia alkalitelluris TaxID=304268 RepID=UPI0009975775|nr:AAA family ATPase [Litchfieldia alkalitelluris]